MIRVFTIVAINAIFSLNAAAGNTNEKKLPARTVSFTENKGQFADQNHNPRPDVIFGGSDGQITFHITGKGISYQLYRVDKYKETEDQKTKEKRQEIEQQTIYRTDIKWLNANLNPVVKTDEALPGYTNYYLAQCPNGALDVKSYTGITLHNIYNNIDLHYYEKNGHLKCDYIIAPHTGYKQIQLKVEGAELRLQKDGSLLIETPLGKIQEQAPLVYQNGKQLKASYIVKDHVIGFEVENYNPNFGLLIDPGTRLWGTYYGGTGDEYGHSCTGDASGNIYFSGSVSGASATGTLLTTSGAHQVTSTGGYSECFLTKFNMAGVRLWGTYYGGNSNESGGSCAVDASGNVFLAGYTQSTGTTGISTPGCHQASYGGGNWDAFLVKFNSSGVRQWGTYYGGSGAEQERGCTTDLNGNVYLAGLASSSFNSTVVATAGSHQSSFGGGFNDGFLVKFNTSGVRQWGTWYGGSWDDGVLSCVTDAGGDVYVSGFSESPGGIATFASHQSTLSGMEDAFLAKFNSNGVRLWGTYYGGTGYEYGKSCAIDSNGDVFLAGETGSSTAGTLIATVGSHQTTYSGAFLAKFSPAGTRQWGTFYGSGTAGMACATDPSGNVYLSGITASAPGTLVATPGSHQTTYGGGPYDSFIAKFDGAGVRQWGTYYGGPGTDTDQSCGTDILGNAFLLGWTDTNTGTSIADAGGHQSTYGGGAIDAFLVKFDACQSAPQQPSGITGSTNVCAGTPAIYTSPLTPGSNSYTLLAPGSMSATSNSNTITILPVSSGVFTLVAGNACGVSPQQTLYVTVKPFPTVTVNSGAICSGQSFTLVGGGANSYTYSSGPVVSPNITSSFTVTGSNTVGCSSFAVSSVTVNLSPTISASSGSICAGKSFTIVAGGAHTYSFSSGPVVTPASTSSYSITGTSQAGCIGTNTAVATVTVFPLPSVTASTTAEPLCEGESATLTASGANTYTWNPGGSGTSIVISPIVTSSYTINGTDSKGCSNSSTFTQSVSTCAGLSVLSTQNSELIVSPNPTSGMIMIKMPLVSPGAVEVYNSLGQLIYLSEIKKEKTEIDLSREANGIYFVRSGNVIKKIIKEDL